MTRSVFLGITIVAVVMAILVQNASAIKCWQCTSNVAFCNDPFNLNNITEQQKGWAYRDCILSDGALKLSNQIAVCKKLKQVVLDKFVITRSCYWQNEDAPADECLENITPKHMKTEFCETCSFDGCNAATAPNGSIALIIVISAVFVKSFKF